MAPDTKVEPTKWWMRISHAWFVGLAAVSVTMTITVWVMRVEAEPKRTDQAMAVLQTAVLEALKTQGEESKRDLAEVQRDTRQSMDRLADTMTRLETAINKIAADFISARQSQVWLDLSQVDWDAWVLKFQADNPTIKVPPVKVRPLSR